MAKRQEDTGLGFLGCLGLIVLVSFVMVVSTFIWQGLWLVIAPCFPNAFAPTISFGAGFLLALGGWFFLALLVVGVLVIIGIVDSR